MRDEFQAGTIALCVAAGLLSGCSRGANLVAPGASSADRGAFVITLYGCGKCHTIPGIRSAKGVVGPPLQDIAQRTYIGGDFPNTPDNLTRWIMDPQAMKPNTSMPSLGLTEPQSRDVVAYLDTLQ